MLVLLANELGDIHSQGERKIEILSYKFVKHLSIDLTFHSIFVSNFPVKLVSLKMAIEKDLIF